MHSLLQIHFSSHVLKAGIQGTQLQDILVLLVNQINPLMIPLHIYG